MILLFLLWVRFSALSLSHDNPDRATAVKNTFSPCVRVDTIKWNIWQNSAGDKGLSMEQLSLCIYHLKVSTQPLVLHQGG